MTPVRRERSCGAARDHHHDHARRDTEHPFGRILYFPRQCSRAGEAEAVSSMWNYPHITSERAGRLDEQSGAGRGSAPAILMNDDRADGDMLERTGGALGTPLARRCAVSISAPNCSHVSRHALLVATSSERLFSPGQSSPPGSFCLFGGGEQRLESRVQCEQFHYAPLIAVLRDGLAVEIPLAAFQSGELGNVPRSRNTTHTKRRRACERVGWGSGCDAGGRKSEFGL